MRFKGLFKFLDSFSGQLLTLIIGGIVLFQVANFAVVCSVQWMYVQQAEQTRAEHLASYWTLLNSMPAAQRDATLARMARREFFGLCERNAWNFESGSRMGAHGPPFNAPAFLDTQCVRGCGHDGACNRRASDGRRGHAPAAASTES